MRVFVFDPHPHITLTEGTKPIKIGALMHVPMSLFVPKKTPLTS